MQLKVHDFPPKSQHSELHSLSMYSEHTRLCLDATQDRVSALVTGFLELPALSCLETGLTMVTEGAVFPIIPRVLFHQRPTET